MTFPDHFSTVAQQYAASRPRYPGALFRWLTAIAPGTALAWDAGCGSGQATAALASHFDQVVATDASRAQLDAAPLLPNVTYHVAAETCPQVLSGSVDLVVVAQAVHWFDRATFWNEVARVLRPEGVLAVWSYDLPQIAPVIDPLVARLYREVLGEYWPPERIHCETRYRDIGFPYRIMDAPPFEMASTWSRAQFTDYVRTWSAVQRFREATGRDPVTPFDDALSRRWPDGEARVVTWPLTILTGRADA